MTSAPQPSTESPPMRLLARSSVLAAIVCGVAGFTVFQLYGNANRGYIDTASLFYWWGFQWVNPQSDTEHGWLILGFSAWLWWRNGRRAESAESRAKSTNDDLAPSSQLSALDLSTAFTAMLAGLALHAVGFAAQQARVSILALLIFAWGVVRLAGGRRWGAIALFPIGFLVFAIPINVLDSIGFWLRMWVVKASAWLAHAAEIGVIRSGTQLFAPDGRYQYDVVAACSGVRSLTAMIALSVLAGYLNFASWRRRAVVVLLCFPLVYLGNVARIAAIIFAAEAGGQKWGSRAHDVMGVGIFVIVLGGVLLGIAAIRRWRPESVCHPLDDKRGNPILEARPAVCHLIDDKRAWLAAGAVLLLAAGEMIFLHQLAHSPARGEAGVALTSDGTNPVELPAFLGSDWIGKRTEVSAVEREILPPDTGFSRKIYVNLAAPSKAVLVSMVLSGRDRTSIHRPELCLEGQGWTILDAAPQRFAFPGGERKSFPATVLRVQREIPALRGKQVVPSLVAYWFVNADTVVATHWQRLARDAWNRVVHARADRWAYILMQTDATDGDAAALTRMQAVIDEALPAFQKPAGGN